MKNFKKSGSFSAPRFGGGRGRSRGGDRVGGFRSALGEMFEATCAKCHKECEVPFRPNGKKPVFCKNCFTPDESSERSFDRSSSFDHAPRFGRDTRAPREGGDLRSQIEEINAKLDALTRLVKALSR